jgi:hypothetical protein
MLGEVIHTFSMAPSLLRMVLLTPSDELSQSLEKDFPEGASTMAPGGF